MTEARFTKIYNWFIKRKNDPSAPVYLLGYDSLPIRADKSLYNLAEWIKQYPELSQCLERTATSQLIAICESGLIPGDIPPTTWDEWRMRFHQHLHEYGHMIYDLDFMHPVPSDDPTAVIDALKLYLSGRGVNPYTRQRESAERRERAVGMTRLRLRGLRLKWFNKYLASAQKYAPRREDGLAEIGLAYPLIRQMLHEVGTRFVTHGVLGEPGDIFWLTQEEVLQTSARLDAGERMESLSGKIPARKAQHQAALRVKPPLALPQMKVFGFDLMSLKDKRGRRSKGDLIKGVAASPGTATGTARVLHGPEEFSQMRPGDVLVESPMDFALWKGAKPGEPSWKSPWGEGRPGWHIECSAMSVKYLGQPFDIHGGGEGAIVPHPENESAQSCGATGSDFVRYWLHHAFVRIDREKMSKTIGNVFTISDVLSEIEAEGLRLHLLSTHYRSPLDFSIEGVGESTRALLRAYETLARAEEAGVADPRYTH